MKELQLENLKKYTDYINNLSSLEANRYFLQYTSHIYKILGEANQFTDEEIKSFNKDRDAYINAITNNKDFSPKVIEWIKGQNIEFIYIIYSKIVFKDNLLKSLKPLNNVPNQKKSNNNSTNVEEEFLSRLSVDEKIKYILRTNLPYERLTKEQQAKWDTLKKMELDNPSEGYLDDFAKTVLELNKKETKKYEIGLSIEEEKKKEKVDDETYLEREPKKLVRDITRDIFKNSGLSKYFAKKELQDILNQNAIASIPQIDRLVEDYDIDYDYAADFCHKYLMSLGVTDEKSTDLILKYQNEDIIHVNIVLENLYKVIHKKFSSKIKENLPKELLDMKVSDENYDKCLFSNKLSRVNFQVIHYMFLYDNAKNIDIKTWHSIFNDYYDNNVCLNIYYLKLLADDKNNLDGLANPKLLSFYHDFNEKYFMTEQHKKYFQEKFIPKSEYKNEIPEAFEEMDKFIKGLK